MGQPSYDAFLTALDAEGTLLADTVARADPATTVPGCPGWSLDDLLCHTGGVYAHKAAVIRLGREPLRSEVDPGPAEGKPSLPWFSDQLAGLLRELRAHTADQPTWTWLPADQSVGFWARRMAQETVVHRVDAEQSVGSVGPVADWLASDGVDELLTSFLAADPWHEVPGGQDAGTVEIRAGQRGWRVRLRAESVEVSEPGGRASDGATTARISADPATTLLWVWGRIPDTAVEMSGDRETIAVLAQRLRAVSR